MPFIRGRYHVNPIMGEALEAAREAEAAFLAQQHQASDNGSASATDYANPTGDASNAPDVKSPIHRVDIEAAETLPNHSGRATRGFIARVHRAAVTVPVGAQHAAPGADAWQRSSHPSPPPETHVFSDHRDLVNLLRDELAKG
ncbi:MAG TPA: hypothetical protein VN822_00765 [Candidatus Acidoferrales bacterium]|nr:hypothetical protein [Candidatus Acidoferrales bacterium]